MPEPPRRKRFQIHLSTAIVMMFVAGGLIWLNVLPEMVEGKGNPPYKWGTSVFGWPCRAISKYSLEILDYKEYTPFYLMITLDLIVALAILLAVCFLCEWLIRRRAARNGA